MPYTQPDDVEARKNALLDSYLGSAGLRPAPMAPQAPPAPAGPRIDDLALAAPQAPAAPPAAAMAGEPDGDEDAQKEAIMREILGGLSPLGEPAVNKHMPKFSR